MYHTSLQSARLSCGYTIDEAAEYCGVPTSIYESYEKDPEEIPKYIACIIRKVFNISLDSIFVRFKVTN